MNKKRLFKNIFSEIFGNFGECITDSFFFESTFNDESLSMHNICDRNLFMRCLEANDSVCLAHPKMSVVNALKLTNFL